MGGIMALAGEKPENPSLWETAERIDLTGASNLGDEPEMNQDEMRAFYCVLNPIQKELRELAAGEKDKGYVDVTKSIEKLNVDFKKIADRNNPEREPLLQAGRDRENQRIEKVESKCVYDDGATRGFIIIAANTRDFSREIQPQSVFNIVFPYMYGIMYKNHIEMGVSMCILQ